MNKITLSVPKGIKYIGDWVDYTIPSGHCIINKGVTGCGFTEYCLTNSQNLILCSPRKLLLENKRDQHMEDKNILYLENNISDLSTRESFERRISEHYVNCNILHLPAKFMITYDSAHYIIDYLAGHNMLDNFQVVVDEMQSIFTDAFFKAEIENSFLSNIQKCRNLIYLSATPMLDKYLNQMDEFKDLDYYYIDWTESGNVGKVSIQYKRTNSLSGEAKKVISNYLSEKFPMIITEDRKIHFSKEAVFYFNSVREIKNIINKMNLSPDQVNILCANTPENVKCLSAGKNKHLIGKIPVKGEHHKMFTFCTSTCYIGADFYSTCASTYIFADPNLNSLALDISLDLPQIIGRQRDKNNLFKETATIFYKTTRGENLESREEFDRVQADRMSNTNTLLNQFNKADPNEKEVLIDLVRHRLLGDGYSRYFVGISPDGTIGFNGLIKLAQERAWEISQRDYRESINVVRALSSLNYIDYPQKYRDEDDKIIDDFLTGSFYSTGVFEKRMRVFCEFMDRYKEDDYIQISIRHKITDPSFYNFYNYFGTNRCRALKFRYSDMISYLINESKSDIITSSVYNMFKEGKRYDLKGLKERLAHLYKSLGISTTPKATDINKWFNTKKVVIIDPLTKKRDNGLELISRKDHCL